MDLILFTGIQASGKSTFYRQRFSDTCIRINLDMLRTRHRERILFEACLRARQSVVVDNTNLTPEDRGRYIAPARKSGFKIVGYAFRASVTESIRRNALRSPNARILEAGIRGASSRLQWPTWNEGYNELSYVRIQGDGFKIEPWRES